MEMRSFEKRVVNSPLWSFILKRFTLPRLLSFAGPLRGKVLEIGCGQGVTSEAVLRSNLAIQLTALDYDPAQVALAKKNLSGFGRRVNVVQGDATRMQFKKNSFDVVVEFNAFHHIKEYNEAMRESFRVLKPGGVFIIRDIGQAWTRLFNPVFPTEGFFSKRSFLDDLKGAGFQVEKVNGVVWFSVVARKPHL